MEIDHTIAFRNACVGSGPEGWRQTVLCGLAGARNELPRTVLDGEISQDLQIQPTVDGSTLDRVGGQST
jgi:hypothetical protein